MRVRCIAFIIILALIAAISAHVLAGGIGKTDRLCRSAISGDTAEIARLLREGADPNRCSTYRGKINTVGCAAPLTWAAIGNQAQAIETLVAAGADFGVDSRGVSEPLLWAIHFRSTEAAIKLLSLGTPVLAIDRDGRPLLHKAAEMNQASVVSCMITSGANILHTDSCGVSVLELVCGTMRGADLRLVLECSLRHGLSPNQTIAPRLGNGETVLMFAVQHLDANFVGVLLYYGGDVLIKDRNGRSALDYVDQRNDADSMEITRLLKGHD